MEEKLAHPPQSWLQQETLIDQFYFTAAIPMRLFSLGYIEHARIGPAIDWLERHWTEWELVTGTWYSLWALLCLYPEVTRLSAVLYRPCYATALEWLPHLEAQPLTWLLDALQGAGLPADEPLVVRGVARLLTLQGEEGAWSEGRDSTLETTVTAVRLLREYGGTRVVGG